MRPERLRWLRAGLIALALVGSVVAIYAKEPILGLDLRGGVMMLLQADQSELQQMPANEREQAMTRIVDTIRFRVNQSGLAETTVTQAGQTRVWVEIPCPAEGPCDEPRQLGNIIERRGFLVFKTVLDSGAGLSAGPNQEIVRNEEGTQFLVPQEPLMTGAQIAEAAAQTAQPGAGAPSPFVVQLTFTDEGAQQFAQYLTEGPLGPNERMAIILDGVVQSAPVIQPSLVDSARQGWRNLKSGTQITGMQSLDEARNLGIVLRSGSLPVPVHVLQENTIGPSIGEDSVNQGLLATVLAIALVLAFMLVYYRVAGVIANVTILLNLVMLVAIMMLLEATWTLPGIAGLILTIGMGVDTNVLIFERVREELKQDKTVRAAIDYGYERALLAIIDAQVTTLLTALILFIFGTGPIQGFATTLSIGILVNLFTALVGTRLAFDIIKQTEPRRLSI